jgi:hypothetical protein
MSISLYTPSRGSIIPPDADLAGDLWTSRAVVHPALLHVPNIVETLPGLRPGTIAEYIAPPKAVIASTYGKQWRMDASISGSGVTFSRTAEIISQSNAVENWTDAILLGTLCSFDETDYDDVNYVRLFLQISSENIWFSWSDKKWFPGLSVTVVTRDFDIEEGEDQTTAEIGDNAEPTGSLSGIEVDICGTLIPLYYVGTPGPSLSGTITLRPEDYLTVE